MIKYEDIKTNIINKLIDIGIERNELSENTLIFENLNLSSVELIDLSVFIENTYGVIVKITLYNDISIKQLILEILDAKDSVMEEADERN